MTTGFGAGQQLLGAAIDASSVPTEIVGGGPEDPLADGAAYWELSTGTAFMRSGLATQAASSGFLISHGMIREATNFMLSPAGQQVVDTLLDTPLNVVEDTLGLSEDLCVP